MEFNSLVKAAIIALPGKPAQRSVWAEQKVVFRIKVRPVFIQGIARCPLLGSDVRLPAGGSLYTSIPVARDRGTLVAVAEEHALQARIRRE